MTKAFAYATHVLLEPPHHSRLRLVLRLSANAIADGNDLVVDAVVVGEHTVYNWQIGNSQITNVSPMLVTLIYGNAGELAAFGKGFEFLASGTNSFPFDGATLYLRQRLAPRQESLEKPTRGYLAGSSKGV